MQARRTVSHPERGWSAVAVHLELADGGQEGFYLTLFPEARPPNTIFLRGAQLLELVDLVASDNATDQRVWDYVAKIPMEPLLPSRALSARLRSLISDCSASLREAAQAQVDRPRPLAQPLPVEPDEPVERVAEPAGALDETADPSGVP